ncbi:MAG: UDP-2,4-diacetamido-2,4,6-trideoxy-beta-L-altropyranose hydrolase [Campylobacterales bacterium]|nr:UDP-2,4-diacetamido-2,4,6-trideoxy-beta-L-altropyranose hydrolase [Campylobacterales bacterium]
MTLIRADSSSTLGLGHIMRSIALAESLEGEIRFACLNLEESRFELIPYPVELLQDHSPQTLIECLKRLHVSRLVIDHYGIDAAFEQTIKEACGVHITVLDDTYAPHACDLLINPNLGADPKRYMGLVPSECLLECGKPLIRHSFIVEKGQKRQKIYDLLIAMGGADTVGLTQKILKALPQGLHVCVLTTSANAHLEHLQRLVANQSDIALHVNSPDVPRLMHQSRRAVVTPSVIVHEVLFIGLDFIAVQSAENQSDLVRYLRSQGYKVLERWSEDEFKKLYRS